MVLVAGGLKTHQRMGNLQEGAIWAFSWSTDGQFIRNDGGSVRDDDDGLLQRGI